MVVFRNTAGLDGLTTCAQKAPYSVALCFSRLYFYLYVLKETISFFMSGNFVPSSFFLI